MLLRILFDALIMYGQGIFALFCVLPQVWSDIKRVKLQMKTITKYLHPHKKKLLAVAFMHIIATFTELLLPFVMSSVVDDGIAKKNLRVIILSSALMLLLSLLSLTSSLISNMLNTHVTTAFTSELCTSMFKKVNSLSYEQYSSIGSSGLLTRSTDDIFNIEGAVSQLVYTVVTVPMMLVGGTILAFVADIGLSLIFFVSVPIIVLFVIYIVRPLRSMWEKSDKYIDIQNKIVRERLSGIRVIRAFNNEDKEHARVKDATEEMSKYLIRSNVRSGFITPVATLLINLSTVAILIVGMNRVQSNVMMRAGDIVAVMQYVALIGNALINLSWTIAWIPHLRVSVSRISEVFDMPVMDDGANEHSEPRFPLNRGLDLRVDHVSFAYPGSSENSLTDVSLCAECGETIAIIGGTGCGKTTLVRLLLSMYRHDEGNIAVGGISYDDLSRGEIRLAYSASLQRGMIFEGSVRDNITMGAPNATDREIMSVLDDCELADFTAEREDGLDHMLVGLGQNVSGGQRQRINMARTVIREAPIYIFDDSFSSLDYLTERKILDNLFARLAGKTKIMVTQRVSTALTADRVYVMDAGRVVAYGSHSELLSSCDIYREICCSQLGADVDGRCAR